MVEFDLIRCFPATLSRRHLKHSLFIHCLFKNLGRARVPVENARDSVRDIWDDLDHLRVTGIGRLLGIGSNFRFTWRELAGYRGALIHVYQLVPIATLRKVMGICCVLYPVGS